MSQANSDFVDPETDDERKNASFDRRRKAAFTKIQSMRMLTEVNKYARALPSLSWIYIGKLPFAIKTDTEGRQAANLIYKQDEQDEHWTALQQMFGLPNSAD